MVDIEFTNPNDNVIEVITDYSNNLIETSPLYGPQGNGIVSVIKTASVGLTDTYTITFTNGSTTTFDVKNGKGITSFELTSSTELTDTYTISYNDGTTTVFTVTNDVEGVSVIAENIDIVASVGSNIENINDVASDLTNINAVKNNATNINTVADSIVNVNSVANDLTNINAVADDLTNIDAVVADLDNIDAASENAALAKDWANKMNGSVDGVEYSAKYYAQQASQGQVQANWNEIDTTSKSYIQNKPTLATVATSGSYNDLSNKPIIPAAQVNSDWNAVSGAAQILNKPTIPTVNNATLTIQKNGNDVQTFTANASSNVTCNITVPTNTNELTNGAGFITGVNSTDVTTALGYSPADVDLSNISSTGQALFDGKADTDFSNVDNTAKILMSGMGMPSSSYKNLSLPSSGSNITAPADGWFYFAKKATGEGQFIRLSTNTISTISIAVKDGNGLQVFLPVKSGDSCNIGYSANGTTESFRFVYAEGSKSLNT